MKKVKRIVFIAVALAMLLSMFACGPKTPATTPTATPVATDPAQQTADPNKPQYGGTFVLSKNGGTNSIFTIYRRGSGNMYNGPAIETLGFLNPVTNKVEPLLAKEFTEDKAAKTVTIKLNEGVMFHDGSELTADVVKWNLEFSIENGLGANFHNPAGVTCPDKYTLVVSFSDYYLDSIEVLAALQIYSKKAFDEKGLDYCINNPIGTGAFILKEYVPGNKLVFTKNPNYWQDGLPYLDEYIVRIIPEYSAAMTAFDNGEIDAFNCGSAAINESMKAMGYVNKAKPVFGIFTVFGLSPHSKTPGDPFYDVKVRQAVMLYGIDYTELAMLAEGKDATPAMQSCIEGSLLYDENLDKESYFDLAKAKQMLKEAGYENGFKTDIWAIVINIPFATALQNALKKLNIEATVHEIATNDPRRYDGTTTGIFLLNGWDSYDLVKRTLPGTYSASSTTNGKHMNFSAEYGELLNKAIAADTYEERAMYGKQVLKKLHVDECLFRLAFMKSANIFISEKAHDTYFEYNITRPELTWVSSSK